MFYLVVKEWGKNCEFEKDFYFDLFVFKIVNRMYYYKEKIKGRLVKKQKPEKKTEPDSKN